MGDWLGTGRIADQYKKYRAFKEAREFAHSLKLKKYDEWMQFCKTDNRPLDIPVGADSTYKKEWTNWGDFLGTGTVSSQIKAANWRNFKEAREYIHSLGIKNKKEWMRYVKSGKKPIDIPSHPWDVYLKGGSRRR